MYSKIKNIGFEKNLIFCFWTGDNPMSSNRLKALESMKNIGLEIIYLTKSEILEWQIKDCPFHEAYEFLTPTHKSDYLRAYFLHYYGGGYSDIKFHSSNWVAQVEQFKKSNKTIMGYKELHPIDIARGRGFIKDISLAINFWRLIGCGAFYGKPNSSFTRSYLDSIHTKLSEKLEMLSRFPSLDPLDYKNKISKDGLKSCYPLAWNEICGQIFHPLVKNNINLVSRDLPRPNFVINYR